MSEEILKTLIKLFAVISKQDGGVTEGERQYVLKFFEEQLNQFAGFYIFRDSNHYRARITTQFI